MDELTERLRAEAGTDAETAMRALLCAMERVRSYTACSFRGAGAGPELTAGGIYDVSDGRRSSLFAAVRDGDGTRLFPGPVPGGCRVYETEIPLPVREAAFALASLRLSDGSGRRVKSETLSRHSVTYEDPLSSESVILRSVDAWCRARFG